MSGNWLSNGRLRLIDGSGNERSNFSTSPSVSFSQLRLRELAEHQESEQVVVPEVVERRNGFFDAIYTKLLLSQSSKLTKMAVTEDLNEETVALGKFIYNTSKRKSSQNIKFKIKSLLTKSTKISNIVYPISNTIGFSKIFIAYVVVVVLCLNNKTGSWLGLHRAIMPIVMLIQHPAHPLGTQFEMTIMAEVGTLCGLAVAIFTVYLARLTNGTKNHFGGLFACFIFTLTFLLQILRLKYTRTYYFCVNMGLVLILSLLSVNSSNLNNLELLDFFNNYCKPFSIAIVLPVVVSLIVFPEFDHKKVVKSLVKTLTDIKQSLLLTISSEARTNGTFNVTDCQKNSISSEINWSLVSLTEDFREFANELFKISVFKAEDMIDLRNCINFIVSPLKSIPFPIRLFSDNVSYTDNRAKLQSLLKPRDKQEGAQLPQTPQWNRMNFLRQSQTPSGFGTPRPTNDKPLTFGFKSSDVYFNVVEKTFKKPIVELIEVMIVCIELLQLCLIKFGKLTVTNDTLVKVYGFDKQETYDDIFRSNDSQALLMKLGESMNNLKNSLKSLDVSYRNFSKTDWFCNDLLADEEIINIFLFLRYHRQVSKLLIAVGNIVTTMCSYTLTSKSRFVGGFRLIWCKYPLKKALARLPKRCMKDRGKLMIFSYFQVRDAVDKSFEKIYNMNTSRLKHDPVDAQVEIEIPLNDAGAEYEAEVIRAFNHADFNQHLFLKTKQVQYKVWLFMKNLSGHIGKNSFKNAFLITFTSLPGLLDKVWFNKYHCYWCPLMIWLLFSSTGIFSFSKIWKRFVVTVVGGFWGWCATQAVLHYLKSQYILLPFAAVFAVPSIIKYYYFPSDNRAGFIGLLTFSLVVIDNLTSSNNSTRAIWNMSWCITMLMIIAILLSALMNIILWPFIARNLVTKSFAKLLVHLSQGYQIVTDRYVYRDTDDMPTELTLALSTIREIRVLQHLYAVRDIVAASVKESNIISISASLNQYYQSNSRLFYNTVYKLLDSCAAVLEKTIEARINAVQFNAWVKDGDYAISKKLIPKRRDSVASIIFNFYVIANCLMSEHPVPNYLPNLLSVRKELFDELSMMQQQFERPKLYGNMSSRASPKQVDDEENGPGYEEAHWTEIHAIAFSKAITNILEEVNNIIAYVTIILGKEPLF